MARMIRMKNQKGFTLVELLIVVAIIGILSTVGIPSFRRMVQKTKKAEAKVNLANLFTAESGFFSQHGAYGNNLGQMGFEIDGVPASLTYSVGFLTNACASAVTNIATTLPAQAGTIGTEINNSEPSFYTVFGAGASRAGYNLYVSGCNTPAQLATTYGAAAVNNVFTVGATADSDQYVAMAVGVIAPGLSKTAPAVGDVDVMAINQGRIISNLVDGVR